MLMQAVDPTNALRIDVSGAFGGQLTRSRRRPFLEGDIRVVSPGDLVARLAALLLDLGLGETAPAKHARDLLALIEHVDNVEASSAWADHRRPRHSATFEEALRAAAMWVRRRGDLLIQRPSFDAAAPCRRCQDFAGLRLASPETTPAVLDLR